MKKRKDSKDSYDDDDYKSSKHRSEKSGKSKRKKRSYTPSSASRSRSSSEDSRRRSKSRKASKKKDHYKKNRSRESKEKKKQSKSPSKKQDKESYKKMPQVPGPYQIPLPGHFPGYMMQPWMMGGYPQNMAGGFQQSAPAYPPRGYGNIYQQPRPPFAPGMQQGIKIPPAGGYGQDQSEEVSMGQLPQGGIGNKKEGIEEVKDKDSYEKECLQLNLQMLPLSAEIHQTLMISLKNADEVLYSYILKSVLEEIDKLAKDLKNKNVSKEIENYIANMNHKIMVFNEKLEKDKDKNKDKKKNSKLEDDTHKEKRIHTHKFLEFLQNNNKNKQVDFDWNKIECELDEYDEIHKYEPDEHSKKVFEEAKELFFKA